PVRTAHRGGIRADRRLAGRQVARRGPLPGAFPGPAPRADRASPGRPAPAALGARGHRNPVRADRQAPPGAGRARRLPGRAVGGLPAARYQPAAGRRPRFAGRDLPGGSGAAARRPRGTHAGTGNGRALRHPRAVQAPSYDRGMVRVLAVSDEVDDALVAAPAAVRGAQLILACGDLPFEYLGSLMNMLDVPLVFVPGNHDPDVSGYRSSRAGLTLKAGLPARPPWPDGAINADGRVIDVAGLRLAGLGGCRRYSDGPNQYTDRQQARRARALRSRAWWHRQRDGRGVDVLLTHAPPRGVGDGDDPPHRGFGALPGLVAALQPTALLHGHVHPYGAPVRPGWLG